MECNVSKTKVMGEKNANLLLLTGRWSKISDTLPFQGTLKKIAAFSSLYLIDDLMISCEENAKSLSKLLFCFRKANFLVLLKSL